MAYKKVKTDSTVISTRMRLARNLEKYPFPSRQTEWQAREVAAIVRHAMRALDDCWTEYDMRTATKMQAMLLQEGHLISPALIKNQNGTVFISSDENVSVMVNEEDHLREQYIVKGLALDFAYEQISSLDDGIGRFMNFAYDEKLGFLTACPSNVGTGLRASVMMFLPALERKRLISDYMRQWSECSLTVRGVFGEGSAAEGHRYQISNDKTLGLSEEEILGFMHSAVTQIVEAEERERKRWVSEDGVRLRDETMRAFGLLTNCYTLEYAEMQELLTKVRLGLALGFFQVRGNDPYALDNLIDSMRPYSFCANYEQMDATPLQRNLKRAAVLRRKLPLIIEKV